MKQKDLYGWSAYVWEKGDMSVGIVPQLGGRIMSLKFRGEELFFVQKEHAGEVFNSLQLAGDKKKFGFRVWGGNKTWVAPETAWVDHIPPLDLDAGQYRLTYDAKNECAVMASPVCRETGLRIVREVYFKNNDSLVLIETIKNESSEPIQRAIWNVSQIARPFEVYLPCRPQEVRLYDDAAYENCNTGYYVASMGSWTGISCRNEEHFKFGAQLNKGRVMAVRRHDNSIIVFGKTFSIVPQAQYGHGSHVEIYNSARYPYGELEVHSPLVTLNSNQSYSQSQEWRLCSFPADLSVEEIFENNAFSRL